MWNNDPGASGPIAHSRYIMGYGWLPSSMASYLGNLTALLSNATSTLQADADDILDDDLLGNVTVGGDFCLDLSTMGNLEVWAKPLTGGRIALALLNRSPANDSITANWSDIGAPSASQQYAVRDIWQAADMGVFSSSYTAPVVAHGVAFLVLTPQ